ncbi:MAG: PQQ-like beta-propeller repeat protein [Candidatus Micrarchaeota archaeon]|nr:PQQ-like beta-propeller repeat protein [Candidatus Micrarchaeota archaeon]
MQTSTTSTPPILSKDYLFSITDSGMVSALNKYTGAKSWEIDINEKVYYPSTFAFNTLFVPTQKSLIAISTEGKVIGKIPFNSTISSPPIVFGSNLIIATRDGNIYLISSPQQNFSSKNIIRSFKIEGEIDSSYVIGDNKIYLSTTSGKIYSVDLSSSLLIYDIGYSVWRAKLAFTNNTIFVPAENFLYAISSHGKLVLAKKISEGNLNSISTDGEMLYLGSDDGNLYAVSLDGSVAWSFRTNNSIKSAPLILKDSIIVSSRDKNIYSIGKNGKLKWALTLSDWPSEIIEENGILYLSTYDGTIYAFSSLSCRIMSPEANSSILPTLQLVGEAYAVNGIKGVEVRTLPGDWQTVSLDVSGENARWSKLLQITGFSEGQLVVQCRAIDERNNVEQIPYFSSTYNLVFSEEKLPEIKVSYPSKVNVNQPIILKFFTHEGTVLTGLTVKIGGESFKVTDPTGQFKYIPTKEGDLIIYIEKAGYQQKQIKIEVSKPLIQPIHVIIIFIIGALIVIYSSIRKGTWR